MALECAGLVCDVVVGHQCCDRRQLRHGPTWYHNVNSSTNVLRPKGLVSNPIATFSLATSVTMTNAEQCKLKLSLFATAHAKEDMDTVSSLYEESRQAKEDVGINGGLVRLQHISMALGLSIGCFLQLCMLGVDYLIVSSTIPCQARCQRSYVIVSSLAWSALTAMMSLAILSLIRKIINPNISECWLLHLECRFVIGVFAGVFTGWTITDLALQIPGSLNSILLVGAVAWLCVAFTLRAFSSDQKGSLDGDQNITVSLANLKV